MKAKKAGRLIGIGSLLAVATLLCIFGFTRIFTLQQIVAPAHIRDIFQLKPDERFLLLDGFLLLIAGVVLGLMGTCLGIRGHRLRDDWAKASFPLAASIGIYLVFIL